MNWIKEVEHMRDYGHTWGPGIDDREEATKEEILQNKAWWQETYEKKKKIRVQPREQIKRAAESLKASLPDSHAFSSGAAPGNWREQYAKQKLELARIAANDAGYELILRNQEDWDKNKFMISIEYYGYLPDRNGNIHHYAVNNILEKETCLQLFADFAEIGYWPTVFYKDAHIKLHDSADLRLEMVTWGFPLKEDRNTLDEKIQSAKARTALERAEAGKAADEKSL